MAGMMEEQMGQGMPPPEQPMGEEPEMEDEASTEETQGEEPGEAEGDQDLYDRIFIAAMKGFIDPAVMPQILEMIKSAKNPAAGIGHAVGMKLLSVITGLKAQFKDMPVPKQLLFEVGQELVSELMVLCQAAKIISNAEDPAMFKNAMMYAVRDFTQAAIRQGLITEEDQAAARQTVANTLPPEKMQAFNNKMKDEAAKRGLQQQQQPAPQQGA